MEKAVEKVDELLREYELTRLQVNVYLALLRLGEATPAQLARACSIHRVEGYRVLKELTELGLVYQKLSEKRSFTAVNPRSMLSNLISLKREHLEDLEKKSGDLIPLLESLRKAEDEKATVSEASFRVTLGERQSREMMARLWHQAKHELCVVAPRTEVPELLTRDFRKLLVRMLEKGVKVRLLADIGPETVKFADSLKGKCQLKCFDQILSHMTIVDKSQILIGGYSGRGPKRPPAFLWTDSVEFVTSTQQIFEELWKNSFTYEERLLALRTGLPIQRTEVIRDREEIDRLFVSVVRRAQSRLFVVLGRNSEGMIKLPELVAACRKDLHPKILMEISGQSRTSIVEQLLEVADVKHSLTVPFSAVITDSEMILYSVTRVSESGASSEEVIWIRSRETVDQFYHVATSTFHGATSGPARLLEIRTGISLGEGLLRQLGGLSNDRPDDLSEADTPQLTKADTKVFKKVPGVTYFKSPNSRRSKLEAVFAVVDSGASTTSYFHVGEEVMTVVEGALEVQVADRVYTLNAGDTLQFSSGLPHSWRNPGSQPAKVFTVASPPSFYGEGD